MRTLAYLFVRRCPLPHKANLLRLLPPRLSPIRTPQPVALNRPGPHGGGAARPLAPRRVVDHRCLLGHRRWVGRPGAARGRQGSFRLPPRPALGPRRLRHPPPINRQHTDGDHQRACPLGRGTAPPQDPRRHIALLQAARPCPHPPRAFAGLGGAWAGPRPPPRGCHCAFRQGLGLAFGVAPGLVVNTDLLRLVAFDDALNAN